jgi:hypothetical protein
LGFFGTRQARQRYHAFVESGIDEDMQAFYARKRLDPILGRDAFRRRIAHLCRGTPADPDIPDGKRLAAHPSIERIMQVTAAHFGVPTDALCHDGRGRGNLPRAVAMALSRSPGGYPLQEVARAFEVVAPSSISVATRRLRDRLRKDRGLQRQTAAIKVQLFEGG